MNSIFQKLFHFHNVSKVRMPSIIHQPIWENRWKQNVFERPGEYNNQHKGYINFVENEMLTHSAVKHWGQRKTNDKSMDDELNQVKIIM